MIQAPKGTRDLDGRDVDGFAHLEAVARQIFHLYQFEEVRIPIFESVDLFKRSMGETSDVVEKEMFTFTDRGDRSFALRPEGTAGIVRYFIEHKLAQKGGLHRLFYMGPMFRAERPQAGRYRQFWQIGSEYFGASDPAADADTVLMTAEILKKMDVGSFEIHVNSLGAPADRAAYRDILLKYLKGRKNDLTEESQVRMEKNPLRVLDSKVDGPKLSDAPLMQDHLSEASRTHYKTFLELLHGQGLNVVENPRLVRGLDYYTETVFELVSPHLGAQSALAAGGRYDGLVKHLGGPETPAVGFALGMDRVVSAHLSEAQSKSSDNKKNSPVWVIPVAPEAFSLAYSVSADLRAAGFAVPPITAPKKKWKNQLVSAVDAGANWAILIGEDEIKAGTLALKNLESRVQVNVSRDQLVAAIQNPKN